MGGGEPFDVLEGQASKPLSIYDKILRCRCPRQSETSNSSSQPATQSPTAIKAKQTRSPLSLSPIYHPEPVAAR